jgi:virulence factor
MPPKGSDRPNKLSHPSPASGEGPRVRCGIIGLGSIAQKAYLPLISRKNADIHLFTRNEATLTRLGEEYRIYNLHHSLDSLIKSGIDCAFIHSRTSSHEEIAGKLLSNGIHVYVDKPITYDYASTEKLIDLANDKNLVLMAGFNRRHAPAYQLLKSVKEANMIVMQKNRMHLPDDARIFIFDDFIHVVDTLLYFLDDDVEKMEVSGKKKNGKLYHVVVQFTSAAGTIAVGIMNRDSGTTEEILEVFSTGEKKAAYNLSEVITFHNRNETRHVADDWESTLFKRGFSQMIDTFLQMVKSGSPNDTGCKKDALSTHWYCEQIVQRLTI